MSKAKILVVEDDQVVMRILEAELRADNFEVISAATGTEAIQAAQTTTPDLMILDLSLIDDDPFNSIRDGFAVLGWLRRVLPDATFPVIIHTIADSPDIQLHAQANGVYGVVKKGCDLNDLLLTIRRALDGAKAA